MSAQRSAIATSIERSSGVQFERYVTESRQRLFRFAVVLCGDTVLAGDLVTDVLGRAFERWHQVSRRQRPPCVRAADAGERVRELATAPRPNRSRILRSARSPTSGRAASARPAPTLETSTPNAPPCSTNSRGFQRGNAQRSCCATTRTSATRTSPPPWLPDRHGPQQHLARSRHPAHHPTAISRTGPRHDPQRERPARRVARPRAARRPGRRTLDRQPSSAPPPCRSVRIETLSHRRAAVAAAGRRRRRGRDGRNHRCGDQHSAAAAQPTRPGTSVAPSTDATQPSRAAHHNQVAPPASQVDQVRRRRRRGAILDEAAAKLDAAPAWTAPDPQDFFYIRTTDATTWTSVSGTQAGDGRAADGGKIWVPGCDNGQIVSAGESGPCTLNDVPHYLGDAPTSPNQPGTPTWSRSRRGPRRPTRRARSSSRRCTRTWSPRRRPPRCWLHRHLPRAADPGPAAGRRRRSGRRHLPEHDQRLLRSGLRRDLPRLRRIRRREPAGQQDGTAEIIGKTGIVSAVGRTP